MKKVRNLIIIISVLVISTIFSINVFGAAGGTYTMGINCNSTATKGSNITLTFTASGIAAINNGYSGYSGAIEFDDSKLEFVSATSSISGWQIYTSKFTGKVTFLGYDDNPPNNTKTADTEIFKAVFKVLSTAADGTTDINVSNIKGSTSTGTSITASAFTKTITIGEAEAAKSSNANLSSLKLTNNGNTIALTPSFNKSTTNYNVEVSSSVTSVDVSAILEDSKATIVSGVGTKQLSDGTNTVSVTVKAENGSTKTYNINIVKKTALSSNANLSGLTVSSGTLSPAFNANTTSYKINVPNGTTKIDVGAITSDPNAKVVISGNNNLSVGKNNIVVEVTAPDGSKKVYTIEATRAAATNTTVSTAKSSNADLKTVTGIPGLEFSSDKTTYDVTVPFEVTDLSIKATAKDSKAKVTISNATVSNMEVGKTNTITIAVTAEDSTVKVYTFNVKRSEYSSETDLKELKVNDEDLLGTDNGNGEYTVKVDKNTDKLDISAIPTSADSTVKIIGNDNLKSGSNTVIVEVTDKNGFTKSYKIDVEKEEDNAILTFLKDYWVLLLFFGLLLLLLLLIIFLNRNNKTIVYNNNTRYIDNKKIPDDYIETEKIKQLGNSNIDNQDNILYNSYDSRLIGEQYEPRHSDDNIMIQGKNVDLDNIIDDDDVSKVKKEVTIVRDELVGDEMLEKEYTITENYRKK
jgi:hypothetical protein